jgi:hypothetical protein
MAFCSAQAAISEAGDPFRLMNSRMMAEACNRDNVHTGMSHLQLADRWLLQTGHKKHTVCLKLLRNT